MTQNIDNFAYERHHRELLRKQFAPWFEWQIEAYQSRMLLIARRWDTLMKRRKRNA